MRLSGSTIDLSASDLSQFLGCRHRTALELAVARGERKSPNWVDPVAALLLERGLIHERNYVSSLAAKGVKIVELAEFSGDDAVARSLEALRSGAQVVVQPSLKNDRWFGRPDLLCRVDTKSEFGPWSYQVFDTKLAKETRGSTILQLALYSDLLGEIQKTIPEMFHVVTPSTIAPVQSFRVQDFSAYLRFIRRRLEDAVRQAPDAIAAANYPEPVEHCDVCRWWSACNTRRHDDDHLSLVAGISRLQTRELNAAGVTTLARLAALPLPLQFKPNRGATETYVRVREQARTQLLGRNQGKPVYEILPIIEGHGLTRLPAPSVGDIFLDIEGDPFARDGGREYLFGLAITAGDNVLPRQIWAYTDTDERAAFQATVDEILRAWAANPGMHVYHYSHYEPTTLKRLMGRYATREAEIDRMLRAELFVDLYVVTRHAIRASVENYSIKNLESLYGFKRSVDLSEAGKALRVVQGSLELNALDAITDAERAIVAGYNYDDCLSALHLRNWLEERRVAVEAGGTPVPRPAPKDSAPSAKIDERARRVQGLIATLTKDVPLDRSARTEEQHARWLLAHLLDWHRREDKAPWWEFFRLRGLSEDELYDEKAALAGLSFVGRIGGTHKSPIDRYAYPAQDTDVGSSDQLHLTNGETFGKVEAIDRFHRQIDVKKRGACAELHPTAVFAHSVVSSEVLADALVRVGDEVVAHGVMEGPQYRAARQLLLARPPRLRTGTFENRPNESAVDFAVSIVRELDHAVLAIQGPPGAGKTYTGSRMICELVKNSACVGVTAVSHKVIRKLLEDVLLAAKELGLQIQCVHKVTDKSDLPGNVEEIDDNKEALSRLSSGRMQVLGGTQWLWARPEFSEKVDVLFVDEAGQMSLANVLAASQAAKSVVLLGDPQQLEQPQQGVHPEGTDRSALEHLLGDHKTMPSAQGIFLPETWRLAPRISSFTSEVFYEGRLRPHSGLENQTLVGTGVVSGAGLWVAKVEHQGNQSSSHEEVSTIEQIVKDILRPGASWIDSKGERWPMTGADILVVAPYNAQVSLLGERLERYEVRIGTVDKFQGQEAPVVIYSMATSTPEDAPRGMEFLYSLNRLNVATSRARCACVLVANPRLFEPECKNPRQMQLANALCRYLELASLLDMTKLTDTA